MDGHVPHLSAKRPPQRESDGTVDLAGDFRDGSPEGDGQVQLDVDVLAQPDRDPWPGQPETSQEPFVRTCREARDAI